MLIGDIDIHPVAAGVFRRNLFAIGKNYRDHVNDVTAERHPSPT